MSLPTSANLSFSQINSCMRFTNGNVGIGTTAPTSKLDINGTVNITGDFYQGGSIFSGGGGASSYTSTVTYSTSANLSITQPTDIIVSGQAGNVNLSLTSLTNGNYITVHNVGNTNGNYNNSSVFVTLGTSSTSGSIVRLAKGERTRIVARSTNSTIPYGYRQITTRSPVSKQISALAERSIPNMRNWISVAWAPELGLFCAVNAGSAAFVMTSPDGVSWTERSIPNARNWVSITWAPELSLFCVTNQNSAAFVMTSPDGITWTERSIPNNRAWVSVTWAPELGLFCAVNQGAAAFVMTSPNGTTWTERSIPSLRTLTSVTWAPELGLFCAVDRLAAFAITSPDGITWTQRSLPNIRSWRSVTWSPELGLFCAVNNSSAAFVITSPDGITWTERSIPNNRAWWSITWAPELGLFVSVNNGTAAVIMTSPDGITWTERTIPTTLQWYSITWSPELMTFCAVNYNSAAVLTSFGLPLNIQPSPTSTTMGSTASLTTNTVSYTMGNFFTDTSGTGMYDYTLTANPQSSGSLSAGVLSVTGNYRNTSYTVTVMGRNGINRTAGSSLTVNEANGAPTATTLGSSGTLTTNTVTRTLSSFFTNPVGVSGTITYSLVANPQSSASISAGVLSVTGNFRGTTYTVTVRGTNSYGSADSSLSVTEAASTGRRSFGLSGWSTLYDAAWSPELGLFCVVGSKAATSTNGVNWTDRTPGNSSPITGIDWSPSLSVFCGVGNGNSYRSSDGGVTWTSSSIVITGNADVIWVGGSINRFIAVGGDNTNSNFYILSSSNGSSWTQVQPGGNRRVTCKPAYSPSLGIIVIGVIDGGYMTSSDGTTWTYRSAPTNLNIQSIAWSPSLGLFVTGGASNTVTQIQVSSNGTSWSNVTVPSGGWYRISWSPERGMFLLNQYSGTSALTSTNGTTWSSYTLPSGANSSRGMTYSPTLRTFLITHDTNPLSITLDSA